MARRGQDFATVEVETIQGRQIEISREWSNIRVNRARQRAAHLTGRAPFHLLEMCLEGKGVVTYRLTGKKAVEKSTVLSPGKLVFLPKGAIFSLHVDGEYTAQEIRLDHQFILDIAESMSLSSDQAWSLKSFIGVRDPEIESVSRKLLKEGSEPGAGSELYVETLATQLSILLVRRSLAMHVNVPRAPRLTEEQVSDIIEYLDENLDQSGGVQALADLTKMDVHTFSRCFKTSFGQTPHQFVIEQRLTRAKSLLKTSDLSIVEIAFACGFSNQAHLTTTFSQRLGVTPARYRRLDVQ
ncbi:MAG: AraC family transcriptional regulator [Pseudomonadota bacterium]